MIEPASYSLIRTVFSLGRLIFHREFKVALKRGCMVILCFGFFVLSQAYSSSLVSYLTVAIRPQPMKTLVETAERGLIWQMYGGQMIREVRVAADPLIRSKADELVKVSDTDRALGAVLDGSSGFFDSTVALDIKIRQHMMDRYRCNTLSQKHNPGENWPICKESMKLKGL